MIAIDTNILIYAHREDSVWYEPADQCLTQLAEADLPWAIPWPCIHEFLAITTHPSDLRSTNSTGGCTRASEVLAGSSFSIPAE